MSGGRAKSGQDDTLSDDDLLTRFGSGRHPDRGEADLGLQEALDALRECGT